MIFFGEASLRRAVSEYVEHDHQERANQGIGNTHLSGAQAPVRLGPVRCHERIGCRPSPSPTPWTSWSATDSLAER